MKTQALKRLRVLSALSKQEIAQTIQTMAEGLSTLGEVKEASKLDFNIGAQVTLRVYSANN